MRTNLSLYCSSVVIILLMTRYSDQTSSRPNSTSRSAMDEIGPVLDEVANDMKSKLKNTANEVKNGAKGQLEQIDKLATVMEERGVELESKAASRSRVSVSRPKNSRRGLQWRRRYCLVRVPTAN